MQFSTAPVEASVVALAIPLSYVALVSCGFGDPAQLFSAELLGGFAIPGAGSCEESMKQKYHVFFSNQLKPTCMVWN